MPTVARLPDPTHIVSPETTRAADGAPGRRAWVRYPCDALYGRALEGEDRSGWWTQLHDVSADGVALFLNRPLAAGTILSLELGLAGLPSRRMKVIQARTGDEGQWIIGCQFITPMTEEEAERLRASGY
jgi:hypothetical protein